MAKSNHPSTSKPRRGPAPQPRISPEEFALIGRTLYGRNWQTELAMQLFINPRTIRGYVKNGAPARLLPEFAKLGKHKVHELKRALEMFSPSIEPVKVKSQDTTFTYMTRLREKTIGQLESLALTLAIPNHLFYTHDKKLVKRRIIEHLIDDALLKKNGHPKRRTKDQL